jgi:hypothetical protein
MKWQRSARTKRHQAYAINKGRVSLQGSQLKLFFFLFYFPSSSFPIPNGNECVQLSNHDEKKQKKKK